MHLLPIVVALAFAQTPSSEPANDLTPPPAKSDRTLTWDLYGADIAQHEVKVSLFNFGEALSMQYAYRLADIVSVGAKVGYNLALTNAASLNFFQAQGPHLFIPVRIALMRSESLGLQLRIEPGLQWDTQTTLGTGGAPQFQLLVRGGLSLTSWIVPKWFSLGGALDSMFFYAINTPRVGAWLMVGPVAQVNVTEHFGIYSELKVGAIFTQNTSPRPTWLFSAGVAAGF